MMKILIRNYVRILTKLIFKFYHSTYRKKNILTDISLTLKTGECVGIIGMNGSGKTTLLNIICGEGSHFNGNVTISR